MSSEFSAREITSLDICPFMMRGTGTPANCYGIQCPMAIEDEEHLYCSFAIKATMLGNMPDILESIEGVGVDLGSISIDLGEIMERMS